MQKQKKCLPLQSCYQKTGLLFKKTMRFRMENAENLCKASAENLFYAEPQPNLAQNRRFCGNSSVGRAQPCQGWGREFESRFPLREETAFGWSLFLFEGLFVRTRTRRQKLDLKQNSHYLIPVYREKYYICHISH